MTEEGLDTEGTPGPLIFAVSDLIQMYRILEAIA